MMLGEKQTSDRGMASTDTRGGCVPEFTAQDVADTVRGPDNTATRIVVIILLTPERFGYVGIR